MLSVVLSLALLLPALTASSAATPVPAARSAPAPVVAAPKPKTVVGQIVAVATETGPLPTDPPGATIVMRETVGSPRPGKTREGQETVSVRIDAETKLLRGKRPVPLEDLKPGDYAVVRYAPGSPAGRALSVRVADVATKPAASAPPPTAAPAPSIGTN